MNFTARQSILFYNLIAFAIVFYISIAVTQKIDLSKLLIVIFLFWNFINGMMVISLGLLTGERAFGFAGVMFVDYVAIAIIISVIFLMVGKPKQKYIFLSLLLFFLIASIFTQTRNPYISIVLTLLSIILYIIKYHFEFNLKRFRLVFVMIFSIFILFGAFIIFQNVSPDITQRTTDVGQFSNTFDEEGKVQSSLISRILIWDTSIAAFKKNPVFGMGFYSFPFAAKEYYTIPKFLFDDYVRGLTPHQTFIAILAETGIVGIMGFIILLIGVLKYSLKSMKLISSSNSSNRNYEFAVVWIQVYILFSMLVTDAWLWGQGLILWAIVLGITIGKYKKFSSVI